ncbi:MAG: hypothetical protein MUF87_14990 [Anaerolineae bacterium]|jgi:hypothetical protein|nr:hypothetical protein [Anaerolineae bacterium]
MIPKRAPIGDQFHGALIRVDQDDLLIDQVPLSVEPLYQGTITLRYGVRLLGKPQLAIVPGLLALDYGDFLTGEDAWMFILKKSNLYPRADVVGYMHDGADEMLPVKKLDLALPIMVLAYVDDHATRPIAQPQAVIAVDANAIAPRLLDYLPHFPTLALWRDNDERENL